MSETPGTLSLQTGEVELAALTWGPPDGPLALCLHGFPDTPWGWRSIAPRLAARGWRVVAPYLRGYGPSGLAADGDYSFQAYARDARALHRELGADGRAVLVGHDWGAVAAYVVAGDERPLFARAVTLAIPPPGGLTAPGPLPAATVVGLRQALLSSYMAYFALAPGVAERTLPRLIPQLWRRWSPGYDARQELPAVLAALSAPERRTAALRPYRALLLPWMARPGSGLGDAFASPRIPLLALHGERDGCMHVATARLAARVLAPGAFAVLPDAGHFLALEDPAGVAARTLDFIDT